MPPIHDPNVITTLSVKWVIAQFATEFFLPVLDGHLAFAN